jgi:hypothetical protein
VLRYANQTDDEGLLLTFYESWVTCFTADDRQSGTIGHVGQVKRKRDRTVKRSSSNRDESECGPVGREVKNPKGVGGTPRSLFEAESDRNPGLPRWEKKSPKGDESLSESG